MFFPSHTVSEGHQTVDFLCFWVHLSKLIIVLCTRNGEIEEILSSSFSEWIIKNLGT